MPAKSRRRRPANPVKQQVERYEIETIFGLERFAAQEIAAMRIGARVTRSSFRNGRFSVTYGGPATSLLMMRSAVAVHRVLSFPFTRPSGLLGEESLSRLIIEAQRVTGKANRKGFETLSISAAGRDSAVFQRLGSELSQRTGIAESNETGDLALSARPAIYGNGWEVLVRLTRRPLSAREWRVCDMPGALDATVAHLASAFTGSTPRQRFLNIGCGSATMLIERLMLCPARSAVGVDTDPEALACGRRNIEASEITQRVELIEGDMTEMPFEDDSFDAIVGDLPFGMLVRGSQSNAALYPATLREAARVAAPEATLSLVTTDHDVMTAAFEETSGLWKIIEIVEMRMPSNRGYISPAIYVAERV